MFILLAFLERFARLLPQTLRIEIAAFIADRLIRALDLDTLPFARIADADLRLQRLLAAFAVARWREVCGCSDNHIPILPGGQLARSRTSLRQNLIATLMAFYDLDSLVAALLAMRGRVSWRRYTRPPRRVTGRLIARLRAAFLAGAARLEPAPDAALELSG